MASIEDHHGTEPIPLQDTPEPSSYRTGYRDGYSKGYAKGFDDGSKVKKKFVMTVLGDETDSDNDNDDASKPSTTKED